MRLLFVADGVAAGTAAEADEAGGWQGSWVERWTLDRCGVEVAYVVTFRHSIDGGVEFNIGDIAVPDCGW